MRARWPLPRSGGSGTLGPQWEMVVFDKVIIRGSGSLSEPGVNLGTLCEAILMYGRVHFLMNRASLRNLLTLCGPEMTIELLEGGYVEARYVDWNVGIITNESGPNRGWYQPVLIHLEQGARSDIDGIWTEILGNGGRQRRLLRRFQRNLEFVEPPEGFEESVAAEFQDEAFLRAAARVVLRDVAPGFRLPPNFTLIPEAADTTRIEITTDLRLELHGLTIPALLSHMAEAHLDRHLSADLGVDTLTCSTYSTLINMRTGRALSTVAGTENVDRFTSLALSEGRAIGQAINSGERSLAEYLPILDASRQFRTWVRGLPPDADLAREYFEAATRNTWVSGLPARTLRWSTLTAAGVAAAKSPPLAIGLFGLSAFEALALDRIATGWRPTQFIEGKVRPFLAEPDE